MEKKKTPFFALTRIRALAVAPNGLFLQRTRARDFLVIKAGTLQGAYSLAREVLMKLTESDFAETVMLSQDRADIYGVRLTNEGWYLKLTIDEAVPEVAVISFHPLERPLRTNGGLVNPDEPEDLP